MKYEIQKDDDAPCRLVSIVATRFGGYAVNFVTSGTWTHCNNIKTMLEETTK